MAVFVSGIHFLYKLSGGLPIKIAFFSKELPSDKPNGVSVQVHRLANALVMRGHDLTCISFSPRPDDARYNHVKLSFTSSSTFLRKFDPAFSFIKVNTESFDILHFHGDDYLVNDKNGHIRTFYGSALFEALYAKKTSRFMYQWLFYFFEWISCFHKSLKVGISGSTQAALPLVKKVVPCGVPLDRYTPSGKKTEKPSILFIGDLNSRKRGKYLLKIFNNDILKENHECILSVVGPQPCYGTNVKYLGNLSEEELITEFQKAWVYCMASSYEGFGVPVIEAMACGTAVVAVDNPGIKEVIRHNYNGLLLTDAELSTGISRVISDNNLRKTFENNGLFYVEKKFDIKTIANEYELLYHSLIS